MPLDEETGNRMELVRRAVNDSPYYRHIKMKLTDYDEGKATLEMNVSREHTNIYGTAHGGAIASICDSACGLALSTMLKPNQYTVTLDLRVNYIAPVKEGLLAAEGEVVHLGGTTAVEQARLTQDGKLVAVAVATHFIRRRSS